ncbi:arginine repressor [Clostridium perfringens]|uniref:Arginine repressor n=3 Tax=Clostridium perfringens TaxID=1502 RepID=A0AAW9I5Q6_CLOPF|nr:arginine regulator [Clostridium perfringens]EGT2192030.1 arginine regulator [Clostridium perfringens]EHA0994312.1 arginine regulator [Clostridium perfringens]EHA1185286.1 arginine regulator [Clostridium perfringens]EHK2364254.1 arginine regulator [Clostridium perfringens]EIF6157682.1 arginine regulator [Clostridium perfringens]
MSNLEKSLRREVILDIIESKCICKQEELIIELKECGIKVAQATLSRDLHEMNIVKKKLNNNEQRYVVMKEDEFIKKFKSIFKSSVRSISMQENFISVNTLDGMASLIGQFIERLEEERIAGTVAKKNHILVLCRSVNATQQIFKELDSLRV